MERIEVRNAVIEVVRETQRMSGRPDDGLITEVTVPIGDLIGFDSHNGIEATLLLETRLGRALPDNLFTDDANRRALALAEIVARILALEPAPEMP